MYDCHNGSSNISFIGINGSKGSLTGKNDTGATIFGCCDGTTTDGLPLIGGNGTGTNPVCPGESVGTHPHYH